jgi:hypothetical protein
MDKLPIKLGPSVIDASDSNEWAEAGTVFHTFFFVSFICFVNVNIHYTLKSTHKKSCGAVFGVLREKTPRNLHTRSSFAVKQEMKKKIVP